MRLALLVLVACTSPASAPLANGGGSTVTLDDTQTIANIILKRYVADPKSLEDSGLLPASGPIYIAAELGERVRLAPAALPAGPRFVIAPQADIQHIADRTNHEVAYIRLAIDVHGDSASVSAGVDLLLPAQSKAIKLCCCDASGRWDKRGGRWVENDIRVVSCG